METIKFKKVKNLLKTASRCPTLRCDSPQQPLKNKSNAKARPTKSAPRCPSWQPNSSPMPKNRNYNMTMPRYRQVSATKRPTLKLPDPTAPHLKYGLFSNRASSPRSFCKSLKCKDSPVNRQWPGSMYQKAERETYLPPMRFSAPNANFNKQIKQDKLKSKNERLSLSPVIAYQPSGSRLAHTLSLSKVLHLDIKPRRRPSSIFLPPTLRMVMSSNVKPTR